MLCEKCNKNLANVHLTKIDNTGLTKAHLCEECAQSFTPQVNVDLSNLFMTLPELLSVALSSLEIIEDPSIKEVPDRCKACDSSFNDLRETGRFGCPECYSSFKDQVKPLLAKIHGQTEHRGRVPNKASEQIQTRIRLRDLRKQLEDCIQSENYELAAELRDKLELCEGAGERD